MEATVKSLDSARVARLASLLDHLAEKHGKDQRVENQASIALPIFVAVTRPARSKLLRYHPTAEPIDEQS
jgi:hypothetical protein